MQRRETFKQTAIIDAVVILAVASDAYGDGQNANGNTQLGHASQALSIACLLSTGYLTWKFSDKEHSWNWFKIPMKYWGFRFAFFDPIINTTRGLPLNYHSKASKFDELYQPPDGWNIIFRSIPMTVSFIIPIN